MAEPVKEGPSAHALRQLNNRNNLAGLKLRKTLEQFNREKSFSIATLDKDRFDTRDFLRNVKHCDSDYLPQSRSFLGSPSQRRRRSQTAKTAPCRMGRDHATAGSHTDVSDDELADNVTVSENRAPIMAGTRLLAARKTARPFKLNEFQRAEKFLRRLREQVAVEELQSHYTDDDYNQFVNAVVSKISRNITPSLGAPSVTLPNGPTVCPMLRDPVHAQHADHRKESQVARFDMVYPIKLLGDFETKYDVKERTPSPSLGYGSPAIRATPLGLPEGGAIGIGSRLVLTDPQPQQTRPWTPFSLQAVRTKTQSELDFCMVRAMLRSGVRRKPLNQRVKEFCREMDEIRCRNDSLTSQSLDGTNEERRKGGRGEVGYSVG